MQAEQAERGTAPFTPQADMPAERGALRNPPRLRSFDDSERHATWLELFFDLVFVVAIAALADILHHDATLDGFVRFIVLFVPIWWAWMGFTFYADQFDSDDITFRVMMLAAMLAIIALAASINGAMSGGAAYFIGAYVVVRSLLIGLYIRAWQHDQVARRLCARFIIGYALGAVVWLLSLWIPEPARFGVWALGLAIEIATPIVAVRFMGRRTVAHPTHIPERFGLFTLIVLGETVLVVATATSDTHWQWPSALAAGAGFITAACMWWIYFDFVDGSVIQHGVVPSFIYGYGHLPIFAGLVTVGAGFQFAIEEAATGHLNPSTYLLLCGGIATYLIAISVIHLVTNRSLHDRVLVARTGTALVIVIIALAGAYLSPLILVGLLMVALIALTVIEIVWARN